MKDNSKLIHPANQIVDIISRVYWAGLTSTSGGNISIKDESGDIWVTPSAIDKGSLTVDDIICIKADGSIVGKHKPSSEFPFHKAIYDIRPDIKGVIHAHPPGLVAFSIVRQIPNTNVLPQAKNRCGEVAYAKYALPGSDLLGEKIADEFGGETMAVILENHGTVVAGENLNDAYVRFETLENAANTIIGAKSIGEPTFLTNEQIATYNSITSSSMPTFDGAEHPADELRIREDIVSLVLRACRQGIMCSSFGTVSVRWKADDFLITPTNASRYDLDIKDIVQVKDGCCEQDKEPSNAVKLHQAIYKLNPDVNSIIITQAPNIMAYGVSHEEFNVRTIPESWIFLQDVLVEPFGNQFNADFPSKFTNTSPAVIVQNDSIIVTGDELLQTFDRLEVAEFSAKSLVMGASLGELVPIGDKDIEDLRVTFIEKQ